MDGPSFLRDAAKYADSGRSALDGIDLGNPASPVSIMMFQRAWDHLQTAAENVRYAARELGLDDPRGG